MLITLSFALFFVAMTVDMEALAELVRLMPPPRGGKNKGPRHRAAIAKEAIPRLLSGQPYRLEEAAEAVGHNPTYVTNVSTLLGRGVAGKNDGPNLFIVGREISECQANVAKLAGCLSESELTELVDQLGGKDAFEKQLQALPKIK